jgi:hypothetical protein
MKIKDRLKRIERAMLVNYGKVLIIEQNPDGTFTMDGKTMTLEQMEERAAAKGVSNLIIDDL